MPDFTPSPILAPEAPWPPEDSRDRLKRYSFTSMLYDGHHMKAFNRFPEFITEPDDPTKDYRPKRVKGDPYKSVGFPKLIATVNASMIAGGRMRMRNRTDNTAALNAARRIAHANELATLFAESARNNSCNGVSILAVRIGKPHPGARRPEVLLDEWMPWSFFPEVQGKEIVAGNLVEEVEAAVELENGEHRKIRVLKVVRHLPGLIEYRAFRLEGETGSQKLTEEFLPNDPLWQAVWQGQKPTEKTGVDDLTFRVVPNLRIRGEWHGQDDFAGGVDQMIDTINNRWGRREDILDKFSSPSLKVPEDAVERDERTGQLKFRISDVIIVPRSGSADDYEFLTWEANLQNVENAISEAVDALHSMTKVSKILTGYENRGLPESGRALKFRLVPSIGMAQEKINYYRPALEDLLYLAQQMEVNNRLEIPYMDGEPMAYAVRKMERKRDGSDVEYRKADYEPERPELSISVGLPIDMVEAVQNAIQKKNEGLATKADAYTEANPDSDPATVDETLAQIESEQRSSNMNTAAPRLAARRADLNAIRNQNTSRDAAPNARITNPDRANPVAERITAVGANG